MKQIFLSVILALALMQGGFRAGAAFASGCGHHCGTERWEIKTLDDGEASQVDMTPEEKSVSQLTSLTAPGQLGDTRSAAEKKTYKVKALLAGWKIEGGRKGDTDFHLVLADPNDIAKTMVVEIPNPECANACESGRAETYGRLRDRMVQELGQPSTRFKTLQHARRVEVTGVGLFDFFHNQRGVAKNCIELHPVLDVQFDSTVTPGPKIKVKNGPKSEYSCGTQ